jgi:SAM-dependent methyltransferase
LQQYQELAHADGHEYRARSPHLKHRRTYDSLLAHLRDALRDVTSRGLPLTMLDAGAGDGAFVEPALAYGCQVTATEMSRPAIDELNERYGANPNLTTLFDADGSLSPLGDQRFSIILYASVLHHIPDYTSAVECSITNHLAPGGSFVSFQDPLWYPSLGRGTRLLNDAAYLSWRLTQGNYRRGISSRIRRMRHIYDEENLSDMVEYHVVRNGVDHEGLTKMLAERFEHVSLIPYWSTPSGFWQGVGERLGAKANFALIARGYLGQRDPKGS